MTIAELERVMQSKKRMMIAEQKAKASFDYILADLIGRSVARVYNSSNKMPAIASAYPSLFEADELAEAEQQKKDNASAIRFKQFAQTFNARFKEVPKNE